MTKFSGVTPSSAPALIDYLLGVTSSNVDIRITIQTLVNLILKTSLLSNPYKFGAYLTTSQTPTANTFVKVVLNIKEFDTSSNFDNATNFLFTAPIAGFYQFNGHVDGGTGVRVIASLFKNGSEYKRGTDVNNNSGGSSVSSLIQLAAGDTVYLAGFLSGATFGNTGTADTYLNGFLVSQT